MLTKPIRMLRGRRGRVPQPPGGLASDRPTGRSHATGPRAAAVTMLGSAGARNVAILAHRDHPKVVQKWLRDFAKDRVTVVYLGGVPPRPPGSDADHAPVQIHVGDGAALGRQLALLGGLDVIVVAVPQAKLAPLAQDHLELLPHLFFHLRPGGALTLDRTVGKGGTHGLAPERWQRLLEPVGDADPASASFQEEGVTRATQALFCSRRQVVITKRHRHYYKLKEDRVDDVLAAREPKLQLSTLARLPGGFTETAVTEQMYGRTEMEPLPARLDHPELVLRHYHGALGSQGHSLLHAERTVLPESFRWPWDQTQNQPRAAAVSEDFVELTRPTRRALKGDYYFLDCLFPGHFGHLQTEVVGRLWGWQQAKQQLPDLKALFHVRNFPGLRGDLERTLFSAYGISSSDLVASRRPVHLDSVVGAGPTWHNREPFYAHPEIRDTWDRLGSGLLAGSAPAAHDRIFVSRGEAVKNRRGCRNQDEVERFFADRGFLVLYPEQHSLREQVAIFAGARVVAGFAGSAMFNLMHARRLEAVIVLSHNAYVHRNEHLFARLQGAELHHFWSAHDELAEAYGRTLARASWSFDFPELGRDLQRVVADL